MREFIGRCRQVWWARQLPRGHASALLRDMLPLGQRRADRDALLTAAVDWLCLAQDASDCGGVCGLYDVFKGWSGPYPETTGYIVPTFLAAAEELNRPELADRARAMLDWLVGVQLESGAIPGGISRHGKPAEPMVFNTGQVIQGLVAGWRTFHSQAYLDAAVRAADWLCSVQDRDGAWRHAAYNGIPHAYYTRVDWPLVELGRQLGQVRYIDTARQHIEWVFASRDRDGWFRHMEMAPGGTIHLHPIAYTLEGLWHCGVLLEDDRYLGAVRPGADRLLEDAEQRRLAGAYKAGWQRDGEHLCLTGHAQMAGLWLLMHAREGDDRYRNVAMATLDVLGRTVDLRNACPALRGGLNGSYPITGPYMPLSVINWGTKFLVDALLFERWVTTEVADTLSSDRQAESLESGTCVLPADES